MPHKERLFPLWRAVAGRSGRRGSRSRKVLSPPERDPQDRKRFFQEASAFTDTLSVETELGVLCVDPRDRSKVKVFASRNVETGALDVALASLRALGHDPAARGALFVDVGAHIGVVTLAALRKHGFERVLAVEPEPRNYRLLCMNIGLNDQDGAVDTVRAAVSTGSGTGALRLHGSMHGKHSMIGADEAEPRAWRDRPSVAVSTTGLADLLAERGHDPGDVGFVKIDTEGHETSVLSGAGPLLERGVPIMAEYAPSRLNDGLAELEELAREHYGQFLDLRAGRKQEGTPTFEPISALPELSERYDGNDGRPRVTDVLLAR